MREPTMQQLFDRKIQEAAQTIKSYIREGMAKEEAIALIKSRSVLGPKAWEMVTNLL